MDFITALPAVGQQGFAHQGTQFIGGSLADMSRGDVGPFAVRLMSLVAGGCLFVCAALYFALRPRKKAADPAD